jgi:enoyl-CoA hydratase/carnithine racemase
MKTGTKVLQKDEAGLPKLDPMIRTNQKSYHVGDEGMGQHGEKEKEYSSKRGTLRMCKRAHRHGLEARMLIAAIKRPRFRNAINDDVYEDLIDVMEYTVNDPTIGGLVLTGSGTFFTSGADLRETFDKQIGVDNAVVSGCPFRSRPAGRFMIALLEYPKLLAAAVNGPAVGIGTTLLFHCDLVYASDTATFWAPFTRLALVPEFCSSITFPRTMGLAKANELLLLGKEIDARTAVEWNICSRVVTVGDGDCATNPFHPKSLASIIANDVESKLLTLPSGMQTSIYFVSLIRHGREGLRKVCLEELALLDERSAAGEVQQASRVVLDTMKAQKEARNKVRQKLHSRL